MAMSLQMAVKCYAVYTQHCVPTVMSELGTEVHILCSTSAAMILLQYFNFECVFP